MSSALDCSFALFWLLPVYSCSKDVYFWCSWVSHSGWGGGGDVTPDLSSPIFPRMQVPAQGVPVNAGGWSYGIPWRLGPKGCLWLSRSFSWGLSCHSSVLLGVLCTPLIWRNNGGQKQSWGLLQKGHHPGWRGGRSCLGPVPRPLGEVWCRAEAEAKRKPGA